VPLTAPARARPRPALTCCLLQMLTATSCISRPQGHVELPYLAGAPFCPRAQRFEYNRGARTPWPSLARAHDGTVPVGNTHCGPSSQPRAQIGARDTFSARGTAKVLASSPVKTSWPEAGLRAGIMRRLVSQVQSRVPRRLSCDDLEGGQRDHEQRPRRAAIRCEPDPAQSPSLDYKHVACCREPASNVEPTR